jgi:hypothetical protein
VSGPRSDLRRWIDDESLPEELRADLRQAAEAPPPPLDYEAGLRALRRAIGELGGNDGEPPTSTGEPPQGLSTSTLVRRGAAKIGGSGVSAAATAAVGAAVLAAVVGWWLWEGDRAALRTPPPAPEPPLTEAGPHADSASGAPKSSDALRNEVELIGRARAALPRDPAAALALLEEHRREFPRGALVEERDAIRVLALAALGRIEQARHEAQMFLRAYPFSPHAERVRRAIEP